MRQKLFRLGVIVTAVAATVLGSGQPASADPTLWVSLNSVLRLMPGGLQVVASGEYICGPLSPDSDGVVDLTVEQASTTGYGYLFLTACDGSRQTWSAPVDSVGGPFSGGRAEASGSGYACDRGTGAGCLTTSFGPKLVHIR
jgi:hypothetical protein